MPRPHARGSFSLVRELLGQSDGGLLCQLLVISRHHGAAHGHKRSDGPARYPRRPMFVPDLRHYLDMSEDAPGPARKMAEDLGSTVKAATAAKTVSTWETALPCRRRAGNRPCPGHIVVFRPDLPATIDWKCSACDDEGVISGWEGSYFDIRRPRSQGLTSPQARSR